MLELSLMNEETLFLYVHTDFDGTNPMFESDMLAEEDIDAATEIIKQHLLRSEKDLIHVSSLPLAKGGTVMMQKIMSEVDRAIFVLIAGRFANGARAGISGIVKLESVEILDETAERHFRAITPKDLEKHLVTAYKGLEKILIRAFVRGLQFGRRVRMMRIQSN